ncbi:hypothetical protein GL181_16850 [Vibrio toranzoniae]|nr:hypothetical protein [Vibrio toranzoniae]
MTCSNCVITKRLRQIPNAWHFSFRRWVLCLRWRCSLLNAALCTFKKIDLDTYESRS